MLISIISIYKMYPLVFNDFQTPDAMDKQLIIDTILKNNAELCLVYSAPDTLRQLIGIWSKTNCTIWERLYKLSLDEYNPLENYNRNEDTYIQRGGQRTGDGKTQNYTYGYNDKTRNPHDDSETQVKDTYTDGEQHTGKMYGNIGVTTSQQMGEQELEFRPKLNIYNYIAESFKHEFCIMVY